MTLTYAIDELVSLRLMHLQRKELYTQKMKTDSF